MILMYSTSLVLQGRRQLLWEGWRLRPSRDSNIPPPPPPPGGKGPGPAWFSSLVVLYYLKQNKFMRRYKEINVTETTFFHINY